MDLRILDRHTVTPMPRTRTAEDFGTYLTRLIAANGFTQATLADVSGVSQAQLSRACGNHTVPTIDTMRKLAPHLSVKLGDLIVRAKVATREELGMVSTASAPALALPTNLPPDLMRELWRVLKLVLARMTDTRVGPHRKGRLLAYIQGDIDDYDEVIEWYESERAAARVGRR